MKDPAKTMTIVSHHVLLCGCEEHHLQDELIFAALVSENGHIELIIYFNLFLHLELLEMQQQVEPLGIIAPLQRSLESPKEIQVTGKLG